jgi:hypothetical protein
VFNRSIHSSLLILIALFTTSTSFAQVEEAEAITQLEAAGGRVMTIAADTTDREVSLYLAGDAITDEHLTLLKSISDIKWLNLANTAITNDGLAHLAELKLIKLHLEKTSIGDAGLAHLKDQTELVYLNLYATKVTNEGLKQLAGLSKLRKLYVWQSSVDQEGMDWLKQQLPELEVIGEAKLEAAVVEQEKPAEEDKQEQEKAETEQAAEPEKEKDKSDKQ